MIHAFLEERKLSIFLHRSENQALRDNLYVQSMAQLNLKRNVNFIVAAVLAVGVYLSVPVDPRHGLFLFVAFMMYCWCLFWATHLFIRGMNLFNTGFDHDPFLKFLKENKEKYDEFKGMKI